MPNKALFASPVRNAADTTNLAGGLAYSRPEEQVLAQLCATGTLNQTFYQTAEDQLESVKTVLKLVEPEFIAQLAVFTRHNGFMKDLPAYLLADLAARDVRWFNLAFPRVIDNGKMLRNFVQIVRSGVTGRKSLGSAPKRAVQEWFKSRSAEDIFRQSVGGTPSLGDVIKLAHPKAHSPAHEALYGYLIDADLKDRVEHLPALVKEFEAFKRDLSLPLPRVPFEMLTSLPLTKEHWTQIAKGMSWTQLRMNLNTLHRHGVFEDRQMVSEVAARLRDPLEIRKSRVFPYQLLMTYVATIPGSVEDPYLGSPALTGGMPEPILAALHDAMEVAVENIPQVEGQVFVCPDVSGSMSSPLTGHREGSTSKVRCIDVAALVASAFLRKNPGTQILPFDEVLHKAQFNSRASVLENARRLAAYGGGGTECGLPLVHLNNIQAKGDLVFYVSDNESWLDFSGQDTRWGFRPTRTSLVTEWARFKQRNPKAKLVLLDIQPGTTTQAKDDSDVLNIGGFSDNVFKVVDLFLKGELAADHWVGEIKKIQL